MSEHHPIGGTRLAALRIALIYALFAATWILLSDSVVEWMFNDPASIIRISLIKGWLFVVITALLLYYLVNRLLARLTDANQRETALQKQRMHELEASNTKLMRSDARFEATFEQAGVGIAVVATDRTWQRVNRRLCEIVGYPVQDLLDRDFLNITHPDDVCEERDELTRLMAGNVGSYTLEKRYVFKGGGVVWVSQTVSLVRTPEGTPDYLICVMEDIQGRKLAEYELRQHAAETLQQNAALERFNRAAQGRELRMIELKREINDLSLELGRPAPYDLRFADAPTSARMRVNEQP